MSCRRTHDRYGCVVLAHHCDWQLNFIGKHSGNAAAASTAAFTAATVNWRWNGAPFGGAHSASAASAALAIVNIYANINNWRVNTTTMWERWASVPLCKCNELNRSRNWNNYRRQPHVTTQWGVANGDSGKQPRQRQRQRQRNRQTEVKWTLAVYLAKHFEKSTDWRANCERVKPSQASLVMVNG